MHQYHKDPFKDDYSRLVDLKLKHNYYSRMLELNSQSELQELLMEVDNSDLIDSEEKNNIINFIVIRIINYIEKISDFSVEKLSELYKVIEVSKTLEQTNKNELIRGFFILSIKFACRNKNIKNLIHLFSEFQANQILDKDVKDQYIETYLNSCFDVIVAGISTLEEVMILCSLIEKNQVFEQQTKRQLMATCFAKLIGISNTQEILVSICKEVIANKILDSNMKDYFLSGSFYKLLKFAGNINRLIDLYQEIVSEGSLRDDSKNNLVIESYIQYMDLSSAEELISLRAEIAINSNLYTGSKTYLLKKAFEISIFLAESVKECNMLAQEITANNLLDKDDQEDLMQKSSQKLVQIRSQAIVSPVANMMLDNIEGNLLSMTK